MSDSVHSRSIDTGIADKILDAYEGRTILITGGRGYIGSALAQELSEIKCKLILADQSLDEKWKPEAEKADVLLLHGDVSLIETWETALPGVDYVFHLAAREYYYRSGYDPQSDLKYNALPIQHLLEVCRRQNLRPKIVFASSANLYGVVDTLPVNEDSRDNPLTLWAIHKLMAEHYFRVYAQKFDIRSTTLRLANVYGPTPRLSAMNRVVINKVICQALAGKALLTYANHHCVRDYVFLQDVLEAFLLAGSACNSRESLIYLIGSGQGKTMEDVWHLIADRVRLHYGKDIPVQFDPSVKIEPLEMRNFVADTRRFQTVAGWKPSVGIVQGIDTTIKTFLSEQGGCL